MNRRDALKQLAASAGMAITPITLAEAEGAELVILRCAGRASMDFRQQLEIAWRHAVSGTALAAVKVIILDDAVDVEIVRR